MYSYYNQAQAGRSACSCINLESLDLSLIPSFSFLRSRVKAADLVMTIIVIGFFSKPAKFHSVYLCGIFANTSKMPLNIYTIKSEYNYDTQSLFHNQSSKTYRALNICICHLQDKAKLSPYFQQFYEMTFQRSPCQYLHIL